jgi:DNA-binding NarL/FixJ family response regulator
MNLEQHTSSLAVVPFGGEPLTPPRAPSRFWYELATGLATWEQGKTAEALWQELLTGRSIVLASERADDALFLLVRRALGTERLGAALSRRDLKVLERCALGEPSSSICFDLRVSAGYLSTLLKSLLLQLGFRSRAELLWFSRGRRSLGPPATLRAARLRSSGSEIVVFVAPMRPSHVNLPLANAERLVLLSVLEGKTNQEIARSRRTSRCTVANQVAALREKLKARTRYELIVRSAEWAPDAVPPNRLAASLARRFAELGRNLPKKPDED